MNEKLNNFLNRFRKIEVIIVEGKKKYRIKGLKSLHLTRKRAVKQLRNRQGKVSK